MVASTCAEAPARGAARRVAGGKVAESGRSPRKRTPLDDPRAPEGARGICAPFQGAEAICGFIPGAAPTLGLAPGYHRSGPPGREGKATEPLMSR